MRRLLLLFLPLLAITKPAFAVEPDIHEQCLQAADYKGCVEVMSGGAVDNESPIQNLVEELKILSSRLNSVSLKSLSERATAFRDALSLISGSSLSSDYDKSIFDGAQIVNNMISALALAWSSRIYDGTGYTGGSYGRTFYYCRYLKAGVIKFNYETPKRYHIVYNGRNEKVWGMDNETCSPQEWQMVDSIQRYIAELTVDPKVKAKQLAMKKRQEELCKMEPWARHLEKNPGLKQWASSNPGPAAREREKFLADPKNKKSCGGSLFSSERYRPSQLKTGTCDLSGFKYTSDVCQDDPCNPTCR